MCYFCLNSFLALFSQFKSKGPAKKGSLKRIIRHFTTSSPSTGHYWDASQPPTIVTSFAARSEVPTGPKSRSQFSGQMTQLPTTIWRIDPGSRPSRRPNFTFLVRIRVLRPKHVDLSRLILKTNCIFRFILPARIGVTCDNSVALQTALETGLFPIGRTVAQSHLGGRITGISSRDHPFDQV